MYVHSMAVDKMGDGKCVRAAPKTKFVSTV